LVVNSIAARIIAIVAPSTLRCWYGGHTQLAAGGFPLDVVEDGLDARVRVPAYDPASILPWGCIFDVGD